MSMKTIKLRAGRDPVPKEYGAYPMWATYNIDEAIERPDRLCVRNWAETGMRWPQDVYIVVQLPGPEFNEDGEVCP